MKRYFALMIVWLLPYMSKAQYSLGGNIKNDKGETLAGANISISNGVQSVCAFADSEGHFMVNRAFKGSCNIAINYTGYKHYSKAFDLSTNFLDLGTIYLQSDTTMLGEVTIEEIIPVVQREDTVVYNAKAYKTLNGADGLDLVKKLPGLTVTNSNVSFNGEQVTQVLVDGKAIYSSNPMLALQNMPADLISKVEVYDDQGEQEKFTGFKNGSAYKTINIKTRMQGNIIFGKSKAIYSLNKNYSADLSVNDFKEVQRISGSVQYGTLQPEMTGTANSNSFAGPNKNGSVNLNYVNQIFKRIDISASYILNNRYTTRDLAVQKQYISAPDSNQIMNEKSHTTGRNTSHMLVSRMDYNLDSFNSIFLKSQAGLLYNNNQVAIDEGTTNNTTSSSIISGIKGTNYSEDFLWKHKFRNGGQTLSIALNLSGSSTKNNDNQYSYNTYTGSETDTFRGAKTALTKNDNTYSNIAYTRKTGTFSKLLVECGLNRLTSVSLGNISETYTKNTVDNNNKFDFSEKQYVLKGGGSIQYKRKKDQLTIGLYYQGTILNNVQKQVDSIAIDRAYNTMPPVITYSRKLKKDRILRAHISETTIIPSLTQLSNITNYNSLQVLYCGNPFLKQAYASNLSVSYNSVNKRQNNTLLIQINVQYIHDYIGNHSFVASSDTFINNVLIRKDAIFNSYKNLEGYWSSNLHISYSIPIRSIKSTLTVNPGFNFTRIPSYVNNAPLHTNKYDLGLNAILNSNINEYINFRISTGVNVYLSKPYIGVINPNYIRQHFSATFDLVMGKYILNNDFSGEFIFNKTIATKSNMWWNVSFGRKIFKNQRGSLQLIVSDLLNNGQVTQYNTTDIYTSSTVGKTPSRNYLLSFSYKIETKRKSLP